MKRWIMAPLFGLLLAGCQSTGETVTRPSVESQPEDAPLSMHTLAEQGDAEAQYQLGQAYYLGEDMPQNREEGLIWLRKAAEQNHASAQWSLGLYLLNEGPQHDRKAAQKWFQASEKGLLVRAEEGDAQACYQLALLYLLGEGIPIDRAKAKTWLEKAIDAGHPTAIHLLYQLL